MTSHAQPAQPQARPFADGVLAYAQAGWPCIIPVPPTTKYPPPGGFTGAEGADTTPVDLARWAGQRAGDSIALRMPLNEHWCVIGIDVDAYVKAGKTKRGDVTIAHFEGQWGSLPSTWSSTARGTSHGPGVSRIRFYRAPAQRYATRLQTEEGAVEQTGDVEIIQRHHRYAVVAPSVHPDAHSGAGGLYRWYGPDDRPTQVPPRPDQLPELPPAWVAGLAEGAAAASVGSADRPLGEAMLDQLAEDWRPECAEITNARQMAVDRLTKAEAGSRHDAMTERTHHLVQLAAAGHAGVARALAEVRELWGDLTMGEDRRGEYQRALLTSARKAVTAVGEVQVPRDPCLLVGAASYAAPAPGNDAGTSAGDEDPDGQVEDVEHDPVDEPIGSSRWWSVREQIGAHAFDPNAGLDQPLAEAVLERTWPILRYAYDSRGWLLRVPDRWELHGDQSQWAVATVASLMPVGDPEAEKGTDAHERAARRARFNTQAGAKAIGGKMTALVSGGMHPAAIRLAALDSEPDVLWAGGMPWSLAQSVGGPTLATLDPSTPHLHSAGVTPEVRPTPLWDAFLAAVFPDPELRAWALRVLAICLTGYADRALPILLGETGRGKTQVVHLLMSVLGTYAHAADPRLLTPAGENAHASIVYALKGRRLSFIDEGPREGRVAQERLKQITGGGELTANQMNQNPITFTPTHTVVMTTNDDPPLVDPAVRSRARLIPCDGDPEEIARTRRAIGHVKGTRWRTEAPGVLAALMGEAAGWLADPTTAGVAAAPSRIRYLAETLGAGQDPVIVWLTEETEAWEQGTASRELYQAFTASCLRNNLRRDTIPTETKWGRTLTQLGYPVHHTRTGKVRALRIRQMGPGGPALPPTPADFLGIQQSFEQDTPPSAQPRPTAPTEMQPDVPVDVAGPERDGLVTGCDGFAGNPSHTKPQVNPSVSVDGDGLTGLERPYVHAQASAPAHTPTGSPDPQKPVNPSQPNRETPPDLQERDRDGLANPPEPPANPSQASDSAPGPVEKPARQPAKKREQTEDARAKKAAARAERIAAAVAEAQGPLLQLPAVVARDPQAPGQVVVGTLGVPDVDALLATITDTDSPLTVDVETSGYPTGHEHFALRTVQLGNEAFAAVLDPSEPDQADAVRRHVAAATTLHAHSATADLVPLEGAGLLAHGADEAWSRMVDTVTLAKLADPASTGSDPGLKQISTAILGEHGLSKAAEDERKALFKAGGWLTETKATTPLARSGWAQVTSASTTMVRYAASDVLDDAAIATQLQQASQATGDISPAVLAREHLAQRMVARVAHRGLRIDGEHTDRLLAEHTTAREAHADTVRAMTAQLGEHQIDNPGSNPQVGAALAALGAQLPRTATGKPSVAQGVLDPLGKLAGQGSPAADLAKAVLDYRHHDTAVGTFLEPYAELVRNGDGRARPTVYTLAADTGRMSCVRPNLQQVPREGGFRACITADPGQLLVSADFAGVELRVAAALSQDTNLLAILSDPDRDLHGEIARIAFGPQATKADRYAAKRGVFGRIYGGGVGAIARGVGVSEAVARSVIDAMDTLTPGLAEWSRRTRTAIEAGHTRFPTYSGRVIHMPKDRPHAGPNYCIQGTARELLVDALIRWSQTPWAEATLLPVHDELVVAVPEDQADAATAALVEAMTSELYGVAIVAEPSAPSFAWADSV